MATEQSLVLLSYPVNADSSALQYTAMVLNASGKLVNPSAGARALGILQDDPDTANQAGALAVSGRSKAKAGGVFAVDAVLTPGTTGKLVEAGTGDVPFATAITASTADGEIVDVIINPHIATVA